MRRFTDGDPNTVARIALHGRVSRSDVPRVEMSDASKLKALGAENAKLMKPLTKQMMDVSTLKEMLRAKPCPPITAWQVFVK